MLNVVFAYVVYILLLWFCSLNIICGSIHTELYWQCKWFFVYILRKIYISFQKCCILQSRIYERVMRKTCNMEPYSFSLFFCRARNSGRCKNADVRNRVGRLTVLFAEADFRSVWLLVIPEPKPTDGMCKESGILEFFLCAALGQCTLTIWQPVPGKKHNVSNGLSWPSGLPQWELCLWCHKHDCQKATC